MAEKEEDLDLDAKPASNKKMIIIIAIVGILLIAGSVGLTVMLLGGGDEKAAEDEAVAEEPAMPETHYLALDKMVITFAQTSGAKFMQLEMQLMAHDQAVLDVVKEHMPVVKNDLLVLLSGQDSTPLRSLEGKEALRGEILTAVQKIVKENADLDGPQAVYFTNFVMQ